MKNFIVGQSGGPTTAINSSLAGVIKRAFTSEKIETVYDESLTEGFKIKYKGKIYDYSI